MSFVLYDLTFLVVFVAFLIWFLYSRRRNLKREGLLFLYKTSWGIKLINYVGGKYKRTLNFFSYVSIILGYILMVGILWLVGKIVYIYLFQAEVVRAIKVPPVIPLVPYLPRMFNLDFLPPFYFTYWIIIIAIIAITHEFFHGIFARHHKVEVKTTGFGFLGPFLAAFVELDERRMQKKNKFSQLSILSAGTFANMLTAVFFFIILALFFSCAFNASGVVFDSYSYSVTDIAGISLVNGISIASPSYSNILDSLNETGLNKIEKTSGKSFFITKDFFEQQGENGEFVILYDDAPAINAGLIGAITEINEIGIANLDDLKSELKKYSPDEKIKVKTKSPEELEFELVLGEHPEDENLAWMGIGFLEQESSGVMGKIYSTLSSFKQEHVYYEPKTNPDGTEFIYNMLWWVILISISVALINMLPVGIFDGGRVFYLTALYFVKDEKKAQKIFSGVTYLFLIVLVLLMVFWFISFI